MLVEALVALSILVVGLLGIVTLLARSLGLSRVVADNYVGMYLASEGIEVAKNILDGNVINRRAWNHGFADGAYEVDYASQSLAPIFGAPRTFSFDPATHLYSYGAGTETSFRRTVGVRLIGGDQVAVSSTVLWETRGGGTFNIVLEDHFLNWRP